MKGKKVTLQDIAREARVSSATVSYVLNYSEKEKISHKTRLKVFEAARKLNYVPDMTAKALANKKSYLIGVIVNLGEFNLRSKLYQYYEQIDALQSRLHRLGYDVVLLSTQNLTEDIQIGQRRSLDAAFIIDMDTVTLASMVNRFYIPLIFIDGYLGDPLFHEVLVDYDAVFAAEVVPGNTYVVIEQYSSDYVYKCASKYCPEELIFVNRKGASLRDFLASKHGMKGVVVGEVLGLQTENLAGGPLAVVVGDGESSLLRPETRKIVIDQAQKADMAIDILRKLLSLDNSGEPPKLMYVTPQAMR